MRHGAQVVARTLAKRVSVLLLALGCLALVGNPHGGGVAGGALIAAALISHATAFGVDATMKAAPARVLRAVAAVGILAAAVAGVWGGASTALDFSVLRIAGERVAPAGALMECAALLVVAGAGAFVFFCLAGRVTALGDEP